jgi:ribonuclease P protein component
LTFAAARKFSFSRTSRLVGRHAFEPVFAYKCSAAGAFVQVYAKPSRQAGSHLGITVNKRLVPLATARNYCKRLTREAFRAERAALGDMDFVVRLRRAVPAALSSRARAEIVDLLHRVRRLCDDRANVVPPR